MKKIVMRRVLDVPQPGAQKARDPEKSDRLNPLFSAYTEKRGDETVDVERPASQCRRLNRHDARTRPYPQGTRRWSKLARSLRAHADGRR
jgi:hypothetical protein